MISKRNTLDSIPVYSPCRQHSRVDYPGNHTVEFRENFALFVKKEAHDRTIHLKHDLSQKVSPYINRVAFNNQQIKTI